MPRARKVGALWMREKKDTDGKVVTRYFSGTLNLGVLGDVSIVIFKNTYKKNDREPDFNIMLSQPRDDDHAARQAGDSDDEEIPF